MGAAPAAGTVSNIMFVLTACRRSKERRFRGRALSLFIDTTGYFRSALRVGLKLLRPGIKRRTYDASRELEYTGIWLCKRS